MSKRIASFFLFAAILGSALAAQASGGGIDPNTPSGGISTTAWKYISAAFAVGFACLGGGIAVGKLGAAAMGAIAEDSSLAGKALPYLGLAEGICLWGFLVALLILML
jgi:ATP synthase subunit C.